MYLIVQLQKESDLLLDPPMSPDSDNRERYKLKDYVVNNMQTHYNNLYIQISVTLLETHIQNCIIILI